MADEALNIVVEDEDPADVGTTVAADADDPVAALRAQIEQANAATAAEREARTAAESRRQAAEAEAATARTEALRFRGEVDASQQATIDGGLESVKRDKLAARQAIKAAMDAGDGDALADAQERLAQATVDERTYTQAKSDMEARRAAPPPQRVADAGDMVENMARQTDPKSAAWLRANRDVVTTRMPEIGRAHNHAIGENLEPGSDEYLAHIETRLGLRKDAAAAPAPRSKSAPVAPVNASGSMGGGTNGGGNEVRLTKKQAEAARDGTLVWNYDDPKGKFKRGEPIGLNEMARRVQAQTKAGLYDNNGSM